MDLMDASIRKKHRKLAEQLWFKTKDGEGVEWRAAAYGDGFESSIGSYIVTIREVKGAFDAPDYVVSLLDQSYENIDSFSDEEISEDGVSPKVGDFSNYYTLLSDLFRTAQRRSKGADKALDSVLAALDDDIPF